MKEIGIRERSGPNGERTRDWSAPVGVEQFEDIITVVAEYRLSEPHEIGRVLNYMELKMINMEVRKAIKRVLGLTNRQ